jgi:hypothetical protein
MDQEAGLHVFDAQAEELAFYPGSSKVVAAIRDHGRYNPSFAIRGMNRLFSRG